MRKKILKDFFIIALGNFLLAVSVSYFILPFNILTGGVAGVAVAIAPIVPFSQKFIINFLVIGLFLIGWLILGKEFAVKTALSSILYPIFIDILSLFPIPLEIPTLLASIYSGLIAGIGIGIVIRSGASTGGMDIPPLILNHFTGIETSKFIFMTDALTCLLGLMNYPLEALLNGLISVILTSMMINKIETAHGDDSLQVEIISSKWEELKQEIFNELDRGVSIFNVQGGYTLEKRKMLMVIIDKREYSDLLEILEKVDQQAFVITTHVQSVYGQGFRLTYK